MPRHVGDIVASRVLQEKFWGYFCGDFRIRTKNNKIKLEKRRGGSEIGINLAPDSKMMVSRDKLALIQDDVG